MTFNYIFSLPKEFLLWTFPYVVKWEANGLISWLNAVVQRLKSAKEGKMSYKAPVLHVWYIPLFTVTILFMDTEEHLQADWSQVNALSSFSSRPSVF